MDDMQELIEHSQKIKLLYVEDNQEARDSTLLILEEFFAEIVVAVNGEDGLNKFESHDIDLVITDINMPKINGLEMVSHIRNINDSIPILVFSAYNESGYFIESIKLSVDAYLLKPIDISQFLSTLGKIVEKIKFQVQSQKSENFLQQYKEITDRSAIISIIDVNGIITYVNDAFCELSEQTKDELIGSEYKFVNHYLQPKDIQENIWSTIRDKKQIWQGVTKYISKNGKSYYLKNTIKPILDTNGKILEYIALRDDITEIMNPKRLLADMISHEKDPVVVYLKIEDFETLEDFYDSQMIELIQEKIAEYLESNKPAGCQFEKVYQLGNGEYALTSEKLACMQDNNQFLQKIKAFQSIIQKDAIKISEVGIEYDMSVLLSLAYEGEQVLKSAKLGIKKCLKLKQDFIVSNNLAKIVQDKTHKNMQMISTVKKAIDDVKIVSYFQPIINNHTKKIEKYESLARLIDENGKVLTPYHFLEISKKGKYYSQITSMVLENSFNALKHTDVDISINLSVLDIEKEATREKIYQYLESNEKQASRIVLELLEDESAKDFNTIDVFINQVKSMGVKIAIDDFGSGYSNYERLLNYQPDILKIDGSLIKNIIESPFSLSIVVSIVSFAKQNNIQTIAEYVESEAIYKTINKLGVDYSQGYYFGKPDILGK